MKILHIGDTHSYHNLLEIPEDIDIIIHSGDFSNYKSVILNEKETFDFLDWYEYLEVEYKILVAGNHDAFASSRNRDFRYECKKRRIIYLENEEVEIEGIKVYGSPYSPTFGDWYFMKDRAKIYKIWDMIPENIDILITHTPPKGVLDLSEDRDYILERCGCQNLKKQVLERIKPKYHCFGHIHTFKDILNAGTMKLANHDTIFSNGSVVTDGKFGELSSMGNIFEI